MEVQQYLRKSFAGKQGNEKPDQGSFPSFQGVHFSWSILKTIASYGAASGVLYSIMRVLGAGKTEIIEYDQALKNLQAITGATSAQIETMSEVMQKVARETKFSGVEIGQAMVLLGQSGFSAAESVASIHAVAMLATGTLSDMTQTADLLTTTIRAYNLQAIESGRVSDIMANAINKSKLTLDKLRVAFNYVGATSSQAGLSVEETAASLMMLANNGLRASTMGTGLRQIIAKMVAPTAKVKDHLEAVGMSIDSINPGVVGFQKALMNLRAVMVDSKGIVDMSKAFEMFGLRGAQAAAVLIRSLGPTGGFHDALDTVYEVGTAAHMASIQQEGLAIKIKNMADRAKSLAVSLGDAGLAGAMKLFVDTIRFALTGILALTDTMGGKLALNIACCYRTGVRADYRFKAVGCYTSALHTAYVYHGKFSW
jgi:TP901 family phage tail tape measure protein